MKKYLIIILLLSLQGCIGTAVSVVSTVITTTVDVISTTVETVVDVVTPDSKEK